MRKSGSQMNNFIVYYIICGCYIDRYTDRYKHCIEE